MYKDMIEKLFQGIDLTQTEMKTLMDDIMSGNLTDVQISAILTALRIKGETKEEIVGSALAMREKATNIAVEDENAIDTCGTGGDGKHTFNVSTVAAIVAAAAG
ncbi:MAG TPA: anthranilate phosphoribosyltransferase, partial [Eubacteriaceae bacterium]|nr:anthranilate phosphoribosyltransferase [Eubacteriaceae bacterium]